MDSVIMSNTEETVMIWCDADQISDIVRLKVAGIICNVTLMEGDVAYNSPIEEIFIIQ